MIDYPSLISFPSHLIGSISHLTLMNVANNCFPCFDSRSDRFWFDTSLVIILDLLNRFGDVFEIRSANSGGCTSDSQGLEYFRSYYGPLHPRVLTECTFILAFCRLSVATLAFLLSHATASVGKVNSDSEPWPMSGSWTVSAVGFHRSHDLRKHPLGLTLCCT